MYKLCKTEQSAARQRQLEQGLLQAMLVRQYSEISISELCDQMDLPRKSFYRYFSGKDGALHALIDHTLLEYESFPPREKPGQKSGPRRELERFFLFWKARKPLLDALARSELHAVLMLRTFDMARKSIGIPARFLPRAEQPAREQAIQFGVCGMMNMMLQWHAEGFAEDPGVLADIAWNLLTKPLFSYVE